MKNNSQKKNINYVSRFVAFSFLTGVVLSFIFSYLLFTLELTTNFSNFYFLIFLVASIFVNLVYFQINKEEISKGIYHTVYTYALALLIIGTNALIGGSLFFWKGVNLGYGYDFLLLGFSCILVSYFFKKEKNKLEKQGILLLFKTQLGVKFIDKFVQKFGRILRPLQYVIITSGYVLMITMLWMMLLTTYLYITTPIARFIKAPPVFPLIPYFPQLFDLESYFPPLYSTYFIIALGIVAVVHEFSHGIYMRLHGLKIKSTGFAFLGPFLGAFVEQDEKEFDKAPKLKQLAVLAARAFAKV